MHILSQGLLPSGFSMAAQSVYIPREALQATRSMQEGMLCLMDLSCLPWHNSPQIDAGDPERCSRILFKLAAQVIEQQATTGRPPKTYVRACREIPRGLQRRTIPRSSCTVVSRLDVTNATLPYLGASLMLSDFSVWPSTRPA